jgi:hypothetical protein
MHLPLRLLTGFLQRAEKLLAIQIVFENILAPISTVQDVVNRARILYAQFAWHRLSLPRPSISVNSED